jgi:hypothetical protein
MIVEDYLRHAAIKAKVIMQDAQGRTFDLGGGEISALGSTYSNSLCSFLMAEGENPACDPRDVTAHPARYDDVLRTLPEEREVGGARPGSGSGSQG